MQPHLRIVCGLVLAAAFSMPLEASSSSSKKLQDEVAALREKNRQLIDEMAKMWLSIEKLTGHAAKANANTRQVDQLRSEVSRVKSELTTHTKESVSFKNLTPGGNKISIYGFARGEVERDSSAVNHPIFPLYIRSPDEMRNVESQLIFHPRNTRLGLDYGPTVVSGLDDAKAMAKVEIDFHQVDSAGTYPESRTMPRLRLGFVRLDWLQSYLLVGQDWDIIAPLNPSVNMLAVMWNAGNLGDRRPMIQAGWSSRPKNQGFSVNVAAGEAGAVDNLRDPNVAGGLGIRGADSAEPIWEARIAFNDTWAERKDKFHLSVWGHRMAHTSDKPIKGKTRFSSFSVGGSVQYPITNTLSFKAERWWGQDLIDVRGGIAQWINTATGEEIESVGGFEEATFKPVEWYSLLLGHSEDHPGYKNVPVLGRIDNHAFWLGHRFRPGGRTEIGLDWIHWETRYVGLARGLDNHLTFFLQQSF